MPFEEMPRIDTTSSLNYFLTLVFVHLKTDAIRLEELFAAYLLESPMHHDQGSNQLHYHVRVLQLHILLF
jgi:hypothetical protein